MLLEKSVVVNDLVGIMIDRRSSVDHAMWRPIARRRLERKGLVVMPRPCYLVRVALD
jgi:hypothetical protein